LNMPNYRNYMTSSGELWLIRHGETEWSLSGQHTSRTDLPLTPEGERRATELAKILSSQHFALVLSSPMKRALETAKLAGFRPEITGDLREWDYGEYEGLKTAEIQQQAPTWTIWTMTPKGGETANQVATRADHVIARATAAAGDVAIFGHGHMLRVLAARWLGLAPDAGRFFALGTASISILSHEHETRVIRVWNSGV
jgi:broad specificity phosphatase PhoE